MHPEADVPRDIVPATRRAARRTNASSEEPEVSQDSAVPQEEVPTPRRRTVMRLGVAAAGTAALAAVAAVIAPRAGGPAAAPSPSASATLGGGSGPAPRPTTSAPVPPTQPQPSHTPEPPAVPQPTPGPDESVGPDAPKDRDDSLTQAEPEPPVPQPVDPPLPREPDPVVPDQPSDPDAPEKPSEPVSPDPTEPAQPSEPSEPAEPTSPQRPTDSLPIPVADTAEARRHLLRRVGIAVGESALREIESAGLRAWVAQQLDPTAKDAIEPVLRSWYPASYYSIDEARAALADDVDPTAASETEQSTLARRLFGSRQIFEQVADVFANTLNVPPMYGDSMTWSVADYHRTVIRAHALGRYADMLHAAARHPAMMVVLDNRRSSAADVNENYGRELLELHTVGYGAYTEAEVRSSSMIMSGRRISEQAFSWEPEHHALGPVSVLGFTDPNTDAAAGLELGDRYIAHLARHPRTAETIARKLAVRFVSDRPSADLVAALADVYLSTDTDIRAVMVALICSEEFWSSQSTKLRRPTDDLSGVIRCIEMTIDRTNIDEVRRMFWTVDNLGDAPLRWGPPNGYPDVAEAWLGAGQIAGRWDHHRELVNGDRLTFEPSEGFLARITPEAGQTAGGWADQVSQVVLGAAADDRDRGAVTAFLGVSADATVEPRHANQRASVAALFFDSPRYLLR
ncbi:DUF1800 family protein [Microbacterium sp. ZW T5_56]|uniref:DUF1800 domain-containing protein n=1 Tax=Microbacterium sp. ZW T5_56 TaxID=3378081 RepID=UPI003852672C